MRKFVILCLLGCVIGCAVANQFPTKVSKRFVIWAGDTGDSIPTRPDSFAASVGFTQRLIHDSLAAGGGVTKTVINLLLPPGKLMQWYGDSASWPAGSVAAGGWVLCNGSRYYKDINDTLAADSTLTPDFRNRFIIDANGDSAEVSLPLRPGYCAASVPRTGPADPSRGEVRWRV